MQVSVLGLTRFLCLVSVLVLLLAFATGGAFAQVTVAQLSDLHIGERHSPHALENLQRAVDMINQRNPDAVIVSGDIGERPENWDQARSVLKRLKAPVYIAPGNHDVHSKDVDKYRQVFGKDYYTAQVKGVTFVILDSQLLGNFDEFDAKTPPPMPDSTKQESERMLSWLRNVASGQGTMGGGHDDHDNDRDDRQRDRDDKKDKDKKKKHDRKHEDREGGGRPSGVVIGVQHIPGYRDDRVLKDPKPYWTVNDPYRSRELDLLKQMGVRHMLVGHWHVQDVFDQGGITWHVAPATSWLPWGGELGFAMHTISNNGDVKTDFVSLHSQP